MADDNRPLKYLRYAVGEIFLVVIGILIALQINTWNEERKLAKNEKSYYASLRLDLQRDSLDYVKKISNAKRNLLKLNTILSFIENGYDISKVQDTTLEWRGSVYSDTLLLIHSLSQAGFVQFPQTYDNTIADLRSTGNLKLLTNKELKDDLLGYYNSIKLINSWSSVFLLQRREIETALDGILDKHTRAAYALDKGLENVPLDYDTFLKKIKSKPELEALTVGMLHIQRRIIMQGEQGLYRVTPLIQRLNLELMN